MNDFNFQLGAEVQLFKTDLVGMIDSDSGCIVIRQPRAGFEAPGMTINEFIEDVKGMLGKILGEGNVPDITLPKTMEDVTKNVSLYLKEVFMLIEMKQPKSVEFAVWVSMDTSKELQEMFPVMIKRGYLKLWKTSKKVILDEMQIFDIKALFESEAETKELTAGESTKPKSEK